MKKSIWYTEKNKEKIGVNKQETEISKSDMELFQELFKVAVNNRKYPNEEIFGLDGVNYYFSVSDKRLKTGTTWSPKENSKLDRLVDIGYLLIKLASQTKKNKIAEIDTELENKILKLTTELKK